MSFEKETVGFWDSLLKLVEKWGYWKIIKVILLVVFGMSIILIAKNWASDFSFERQKEAMSEVMSENDDQRLEEHNDQMQMRGKIKPYITSLLKQALNDMNADRAFVIELHNGSNNTAGLPFIHCTMTYEQVARNVESIDEDYQNISLSRFDFPEYLHNHDLWMGEIDEFGEIDPKATSRMKNNDVTYLVITTIRSEEDEIGYFGFTYCDGKQPKDSKTITEFLVYSVQKLSKWLYKDIK